MRVRDKWFGFPRLVPSPLLRLFCFPYAGGGASIFRNWPDLLPPSVEVCGIQLPGREGRFKEATYTRLPDLVRTLSEALVPYTDVPYVFFGHSMGALIAFSVARELRRNKQAEPSLLVVSGHRAPQRPRSRPPIHDLPDEEFLKEIRDLDGTPEAVLEDEELLKLLMPVLRADFAVCETFEYATEPPLDCPIAAFGGIHDREISREDVAAWSRQTTSSHSVQMFPGGHFFLLEHRDRLLVELSRRLDPMVAGKPPFQ